MRNTIEELKKQVSEIIEFNPELEKLFNDAIKQYRIDMVDSCIIYSERLLDGVVNHDSTCVEIIMQISELEKWKESL
jgi:hypothetical protein